MTPTIGRVVIYTLSDKEKLDAGFYTWNEDSSVKTANRDIIQYPAIITKVHNATCVDLTIFTNWHGGPIQKWGCIEAGIVDPGWAWPVIHK